MQADARQAEAVWMKSTKPDDFLSMPSIDSSIVEENEKRKKAKPHKAVRDTTSWEPLMNKFLYKKHEYAQQYAALYSHRLRSLQPGLLASVEQKWCVEEGLPIVDRILQLTVGVKCVVAGTLFKEMPLRPNILESYAKERSIVPPMNQPSYISENDVLVLEDDSGRIKLQGQIEIGALLTGTVVAVKGIELPGGEFEVEEMVLPGIPPQPPRIAPPTNVNYVALVSGLRIGDESRNPLLLQMFADYLTGHLGSSYEEKLQAKVVRLIIAGNSVVPPEETPEGANMKNYQKKLSNNVRSRLLGPTNELDQCLGQLASSIDVDLMPGGNDPANFALPQQPFNKCLFPIASQYPSLHCTTNPYSTKIDETIFFGHSGQPVDDMRKYVNTTNTLDLLENTLKWRHCAPTAPDTLGCYPFSQADPFIIESCPHVYFAGNQPSFDTKMIKGKEGQQVRLISLPSFSETGTIVLLNLGTLDCHPITFEADIFE